MTVRRARANVADLVGSVSNGQEAVVLERKGKPMAVVISPEVDEELETEHLARAKQAIAQIGEQNRDEDPDEVLREVTAVVEEVRRERYAQKQRQAQDRR
jgi:PHD/YefM family antitoxin component YafN of YafNO toxin-antitoxin module